jgi:hypothetical protein
MKNRITLRALAFIALSLFIPIVATAQSYGSYGQNVQIAQPTLPPLGPGSSTIGSIGNSAFGITGPLPAGTNNIGTVSLFLPYSSVPFPSATQTPAANTAIVEACPVAVPTAVASGQVIPITCSPTNGGINLGPLTATVGEPYSMVTQGQTALQSSGVGMVCIYNSATLSLTTGQAVPCQTTSSGAMLTYQTNAVQPYSYTYSQTALPGSFVGMGGYNGASFNPAYVDSSGIVRGATCNVASTNCEAVGNNGAALYEDVSGSVSYVSSTPALIAAASAIHVIERILVTTVPTTTGALTCYANTAASGQVIAVVATTAEVSGGNLGPFEQLSSNGIYCTGGGTGGAYTISYE